MAGKTFDIRQAPEIGAYVAKGMEGAAKRAMLATANRLVGRIQTEIIPKEDPQPVDRGIYRAGWRAAATSDGAEVFNTVPHAPIIEYGARAENIKIGRAMIDALEKWVVRKGLVDAAEARGVAFAIATAMKKRGIFNRGGKKGLRVLEKALTVVGKYVNEEFAREVRREFGG